ncbi:RFA3-like protein [Mya arenaria]|uniref:RFA3-like protein n=1 Tax=Mya arenaria TaxID=6604 RepID=A0ABY7DCZ7_MYAAR|nr:RFA3-like protein [Mya arenaria]
MAKHGKSKIKMDEHQTTRVNAAMLPSYQGKNVCLMGMAKDVDTNGTSFTLTTSDGKDVRIQMQEPVHGQVDGRNSIQCQNYISFSDETSQSFSLDLYNSAVELMVRAPQHYQQGIQPSQ